MGKMPILAWGHVATPVVEPHYDDVQDVVVLRVVKKVQKRGGFFSSLTPKLTVDTATTGSVDTNSSAPVKTPNCMYSSEGEAIPSFPVEVQTDSLEIDPQRYSSPWTSRSRFVYSKSLKRDILEELDFVGIQIDDAFPRPRRLQVLAPFVEARKRPQRSVKVNDPQFFQQVDNANKTCPHRSLSVKDIHRRPDAMPVNAIVARQFPALATDREDDGEQDDDDDDESMTMNESALTGPRAPSSLQIPVPSPRPLSPLLTPPSTQMFSVLCNPAFSFLPETTRTTVRSPASLSVPYEFAPSHTDLTDDDDGNESWISAANDSLSAAAVPSLLDVVIDQVLGDDEDTLAGESMGRPLGLRLSPASQHDSVGDDNTSWFSLGTTGPRRHHGAGGRTSFLANVLNHFWGGDGNDEDEDNDEIQDDDDRTYSTTRKPITSFAQVHCGERLEGIIETIQTVRDEQRDENESLLDDDDDDDTAYTLSWSVDTRTPNTQNMLEA